ncbi:hypothetical protein TNCV_4877131 [Trichonephila clavipes]|nr:hypothetical protein TNCV_4877131 [Trichonephila clavipes]
MDQIDAFAVHISTTVVPETLPEKPDALEYAAQQGQVRLQAIASYPGSCICRDKQKTFGTPSSKKNRVFITPVIRPLVLIARPSTTLSTPQPLSIPEPPERTTSQIPDPPALIPLELTTLQILLPDPLVQTTPQMLLPVPPPELTTPPQPPELTTPPQRPELMTPQILLPDTPPVVETLEPTLMDASSIDEIMSSVFGDISQLPTAHTQEPQLLDTVPSQFDESNDLISFLDSFEKGLAIQQQEAPMDLTMPRRKKKV